MHFNVIYRIGKYFRGEKYREIRENGFVIANFFPRENEVFKHLQTVAFTAVYWSSRTFFPVKMYFLGQNANI